MPVTTLLQDTCRWAVYRPYRLSPAPQTTISCFSVIKIIDFISSAFDDAGTSCSEFLLIEDFCLPLQDCSVTRANQDDPVIKDSRVIRDLLATLEQLASQVGLEMPAVQVLEDQLDPSVHRASKVK